MFDERTNLATSDASPPSASRNYPFAPTAAAPCRPNSAWPAGWSTDDTG